MSSYQRAIFIVPHYRHRETLQPTRAREMHFRLLFASSSRSEEKERGAEKTIVKRQTDSICLRLNASMHISIVFLDHFYRFAHGVKKVCERLNLTISETVTRLRRRKQIFQWHV